MSVPSGDTKPLPAKAKGGHFPRRATQRLPPPAAASRIRPAVAASPGCCTCAAPMSMPAAHGDGDRRRYYGEEWRRAGRSGSLQWATVVVFTVLAVVVLAAALAVLLVVLVLQPRTPYVAVRSARLDGLVYDGEGAVDAELSVGVVAANGNARTDVSFSDLELRLSFHGEVIAVLRAYPFAVPRKGELPLGYVARSSGIPLDDAGRAALEAALSGGVVPFSVAGQARVHWKLGSLDAVRFWARLRCDLRFFWPNGTALDFSCKSKPRLL